MVSHYVPYFTVQRNRWLRAACGVFVGRDEHTPEPTCPRCQAWLEAEPPKASDLEQQWNAQGESPR